MPTKAEVDLDSAVTRLERSESAQAQVDAGREQVLEDEAARIGKVSDALDAEAGTTTTQPAPAAPAPPAVPADPADPGSGS